MKRLTLALPAALLAVRALGSDFVLPDGTRIALVEKSFDASKHKVTYCKNDTPCACKVDGQWPLGTTPCDLPQREITALTATIAGKSYRLDTSRMYNAQLSQIRPEGQFKVQCKKGNCTVTASFSDGAGSYVAEWQIQNGKSRRTLLSSDEEIVDRVVREVQK